MQEDYLHRINLTHRICKKKLTEIQRERSWGLSERQPPFSVYGMRNIVRISDITTELEGQRGPLKRQSEKARKYLTIIALGLAGGSIYFIPYVKYVFYDAQLAAMGINNTQSGLLLTMYTIGNMVLYIPGGYLADKVSTKKALIISLVATSVLTWVYAFSLNFVVSMIIWLGLSFSTAFVFWSALMKAVRIVGTEEEQGFMYGLYYACNGIAAALTSFISLYAYNTAGEDIKSGFVRGVNASGVVVLIAAICLVFLMKEDAGKVTTESDDDKISLPSAVPAAQGFPADTHNLQIYG